MNSKKFYTTNLTEDGKTLINVAPGELSVYIIPEGVTTVAYNAFQNCECINTLVIPASVAFFGIDACRGCTGVKHVMYEGTLEQWFEIDFTSKFSNPLVHGASLSIDDFPIVSLSVPSTVTEIRRYAFNGCNTLCWVDIPSSVEVISHDAFASCEKLEAVYLHTGLRTVGANAFAWCPSLTQIKLPLSVREIEQHAFAWCGSLTGLFIPKGVDQIGSGIALGDNNVEFYCEGDPNQKWWSGTWNKVNAKARTSRGTTHANIPAWWFEQNVVCAPSV